MFILILKSTLVFKRLSISINTYIRAIISLSYFLGIRIIRLNVIFKVAILVRNKYLIGFSSI